MNQIPKILYILNDEFEINTLIGLLNFKWSTRSQALEKHPEQHSVSEGLLWCGGLTVADDDCQWVTWSWDIAGTMPRPQLSGASWWKQGGMGAISPP